MVIRRATQILRTVGNLDNYFVAVIPAEWEGCRECSLVLCMSMSVLPDHHGSENRYQTV